MYVLCMECELLCKTESKIKSKKKLEDLRKKVKKRGRGIREGKKREEMECRYASGWLCVGAYVFVCVSKNILYQNRSYQYSTMPNNQNENNTKGSSLLHNIKPGQYHQHNQVKPPPPISHHHQ